MTGQVPTHLQDMTTVEAAAQKVPDTAVSTGGTYFQLSWYHLDMSLGLQNSHGLPSFLHINIHGFRWPDFVVAT